MVLKKSYLKKVFTVIKSKKSHNNELKECNYDLAKIEMLTIKSKKLNIYWRYIEINIFN